MGLIIQKADSFLGVPYDYGGTTREGMDCSGLIYVAYLSENIRIPRVSKDMAEAGTEVPISDTQPGDILCFLNSSKTRVNHVALVTENQGGIVTFIHATEKKGVIYNTNKDGAWIGHWRKFFLKAVRPNVISQLTNY